MGIRHRPDRKLQWQVRVYTGKSARGTSQYIGESYATEREAQRAEEALIDQVAAGMEPDVPTTINQLLDRYFADGGTRHPEDDDDVATNRLRPFLGRLKLSHLTPARIDKWTKMLVTQGWDGTPLAADTVQRTLNILSGACSLAVRYGWLTVNPCERARKYRTLKKDRHGEYTPSLDVVLYALDAADEQLALIIRVAIGTGAREGELAALRRSCFAGNVLTISESVYDRRKSSGGPVLGATKNEDVRQVTIDDDLRDLLAAHFVLQEASAAAAEHTFAKDPFLFSPRPDCSTHYRADGIYRKMKYLIDAKKGGKGTRTVEGRQFAHPVLREPQRLTPHSLRRFHATMLTAAGVPLPAVQRRLGHADQKTTERYIGGLPQADADAARLMGAVFAGRNFQ